MWHEYIESRIHSTRLLVVRLRRSHFAYNAYSLIQGQAYTLHSTTMSDKRPPQSQSFQGGKNKSRDGHPKRAPGGPSASTQSSQSAIRGGETLTTVGPRPSSVKQPYSGHAPTQGGARFAGGSRTLNQSQQGSGPFRNFVDRGRPPPELFAPDKPAVVDERLSTSDELIEKIGQISTGDAGPPYSASTGLWHSRTSGQRASQPLSGEVSTKTIL